MSSISTMSTLGAPAGAFTSNRGGALALRTSSSVIVRVLGLRDRQDRAVGREHDTRGGRLLSGDGRCRQRGKRRQHAQVQGRAYRCPHDDFLIVGAFGRPWPAPVAAP